MGEIMTSIPFPQLVDWVIREHKEKGTVFGVHKAYVAKEDKVQTIFGRKLETPIGPAAGPNSQLAQNIIASYYSGARFFELKTVQEMDGADMVKAVNKPCILAEDECYNCEWSTELYVYQAYEEYVKAWFVLHLMAKEFGLGSTDGFQFNISVGYNLDDIKKEKTNTFIDDMIEAKDNKVFKACKEFLIGHVAMFDNVTVEDIEATPSAICNSATISTLHGCPPAEIESIANHLLKEKHINTFIKCNPTLLGYDFARKTMDDMGYDYLVFGDFHFKDDLQYADAIPMLTRLMALSEDLGLEFGVKITNTFPVDVKANELPSEEMYMSGKSLFPLSINLAAKLSREFDGKLRIAYSGGIEAFNVQRVVGAGIWPVTMATTLLKPGGYNRFDQIANLLEDGSYHAWDGVDVDRLNGVAEDALTNPHHLKAAKELPSRKSEKKVPLLDCFNAPCQEGCPIHQDITNYVALAGEGKYEDALKVILEKNALPFITGTICAHPCMTKCTRNFYDEPVNIRGTKLLAAEKAYDAVLPDLKPLASLDKKVAVVGGGPAGIAAAFYLLRAGAKVSIFEKEAVLGGIVRCVIPSFRISNEAIAKDIGMIEKLGADIHTSTEISSIEDLKKDYDAVILAIGAEKPGFVKLEEGVSLNAIEFLREFKASDGNVDLGSNVVVIGGGNTAMDTARAAKRNAGVENVYLVYRRTKRYMPADEEELVMAIEDGVEFKNLLSPVKLADGKLTCQVMALSDERDASGRRKVVATEETVDVPADTVIAAVGEKVSTDFYQANGINVDERGKALVNDKTAETSVPGVYVIGDALGGPATVVRGMADARLAVEAILGDAVAPDLAAPSSEEECIGKKGILVESKDVSCEKERCLTCNKVCENCVDVCPNRANQSIKVPGMDAAQIIHVDYMCNECANCKVFCPYASSPFLDKFTLFATEEDMADSKNAGFVVLDAASKKVKVRFLDNEVVTTCDDPASPIYEGLRKLMAAVITDYPWLLLTDPNPTRNV